MRNLNCWIEAGVIVRSRGLHGEVLAEILGDLAWLFEEGLRVRLTDRAGEESFAVIRSVRKHQDRYILELEGVGTCEAADRLRSRLMWVARDAVGPLESGRWFIQDLIGVEVYTDEGEHLGKLTEVMHMPANDVYVVRGTGGEVLLPAIQDVVREVDIEAGRMVVHLLEGLR